jgi:Fe-S cluster assembly protein SufD
MPQLQLRRCTRRDAQLRRRECRSRAAAAIHDPFIANALDLVPLTVAPIEKLKVQQQQAVDQLSAAQMPTRADESFRFTSFSKLLENRLQPPSAVPSASVPASYPQVSEDAAQFVLVNGHVDTEASSLHCLPDAMYVGSLARAPAEAQAALGRLSSQRGGVFTWMNAATAADVQVCYLPAGVECAVPLHVLSFSSSASEAGHAVMYSPRLLIVAEEHAKVEVIEEFVGQPGEGKYFMNSVTEMVLAPHATISHRLVQTEADDAFHVNNTFVQQDRDSTYELVEVSLGAQLSRYATVRSFDPDTVSPQEQVIIAVRLYLDLEGTRIFVDAFAPGVGKAISDFALSCTCS